MGKDFSSHGAVDKSVDQTIAITTGQHPTRIGAETKTRKIKKQNKNNNLQICLGCLAACIAVTATVTSCA
ncbi:MAG: hypothetical protein KF804_06830 [Burkholderiales bacterium]|nr:hypothetical protein [Burkholderiales bacterium]